MNLVCTVVQVGSELQVLSTYVGAKRGQKNIPRIEIWGYNAYTACSLQEVDYYLRSALQNRISLANENRAQLIHNNSTLMTRIE